MIHIKYILIAIALFSFSTAFAQFQGKGSIDNREIKSVQFVKDNASKLDNKDIAVKLKGCIVEQINSEDFWFQDSTGKVRIEIDSNIMPNTPFNEKTKLIIIGEVDSDFFEGVQIEVDRIEIVKSATQNKEPDR